MPNLTFNDYLFYLYLLQKLNANGLFYSMSQKGNKIMINAMCRQWLVALSGPVRAAICVKCLICRN